MSVRAVLSPAGGLDHATSSPSSMMDIDGDSYVFGDVPMLEAAEEAQSLTAPRAVLEVGQVTGPSPLRHTGQSRKRSWSGDHYEDRSPRAAALPRQPPAWMTPELEAALAGHAAKRAPRRHGMGEAPQHPRVLLATRLQQLARMPVKAIYKIFETLKSEATLFAVGIDESNRKRRCMASADILVSVRDAAFTIGLPGKFPTSPAEEAKATTTPDDAAVENAHVPASAGAATSQDTTNSPTRVAEAPLYTRTHDKRFEGPAEDVREYNIWHTSRVKSFPFANPRNQFGIWTPGHAPLSPRSRRLPLPSCSPTPRLRIIKRTPAATRTRSTLHKLSRTNRPGYASELANSIERARVNNASRYIFENRERVFQVAQQPASLAPIQEEAEESTVISQEQDDMTYTMTASVAKAREESRPNGANDQDPSLTQQVAATGSPRQDVASLSQQLPTLSLAQGQVAMGKTEPVGRWVASRPVQKLDKNIEAVLDKAKVIKLEIRELVQRHKQQTAEGKRPYLEYVRAKNLRKAQEEEQRQQGLALEKLKSEQEAKRLAAAQAEAKAAQAKRITQAQLAKAEKKRLEQEQRELELKKQQGFQIASAVPDAWAAKLNDIPGSGNAADAIVTIKGTPIKLLTFERILSDAGLDSWLDDDAVNSFIGSMVDALNEAEGWTRGKPAPYAFFNSAWWNTYKEKGIRGIQRWSKRQNVNGVKLLSAKKIFFPINTGSHWTLLLIDPANKSIEMLDSLGGAGHNHVEAAREWLEMELGDQYRAGEWSQGRERSQRQSNMNDCGVFACYNALAAGTGVQYREVNAAKMPLARRQMAAILLNGGFTNDFKLKE